MTDSELKRLGRRELIEILCSLKKENDELESRIQKLQAQLDDRNIKIRNSGTLAEAMVSVNGVMDAAQKAADEYLEKIQQSYENIDRTCTEMINKTKAYCLRKEEEADHRINAKWAEFDRKVEEYLKIHTELQTLLENKRE